MQQGFWDCCEIIASAREPLCRNNNALKRYLHTERQREVQEGEEAAICLPHLVLLGTPAITMFMMIEGQAGRAGGVRSRKRFFSVDL